MYAEISQHVLNQFDNLIEEGHIYQLSRCRVANAKTLYKPIDGCYMIYFTVHSQVVLRNHPTTCPRYTYKLTSFGDLSMLVGNVERFVDVLSVTIEVGEAQVIHLSNNHATASLLLPESLYYEILAALEHKEPFGDSELPVQCQQCLHHRRSKGSCRPFCRMFDED
ncbi:unnamed protein product [Urochloa humidicola]